MRRRTFLGAAAGAAGLGIGAGAWAATGDGTGRLRETTVQTLDARGSEAGTVTVPDDRPVVLDLFATVCGPCKPQTRAVAVARDRLGDSARFISVTGEPIGETGISPAGLREWWREADGDWTLAHDREAKLVHALDARQIPFLAIVTPDGHVAYRETARPSIVPADRIVAKVEEVTG
ncbi:TlpA family protein disulfide reductase [Haloarchaeobius sp. HME9146]|uniref:TlpA family protein disulfide reductase n=1 Tax=Haloarchaeobius sp. HME9146 TaxID=2978732 RepID=UPI0021C175CF|nr:TlpA family protein disulfide reductase [Haloarchaeobius sp. HME9146]MCT9094585.1 TlpA family protein disulfide reductase [Haloarchaeobius sp. HME9146]